MLNKDDIYKLKKKEWFSMCYEKNFSVSRSVVGITHRDKLTNQLGIGMGQSTSDLVPSNSLGTRFWTSILCVKRLDLFLKNASDRIDRSTSPSMSSVLWSEVRYIPILISMEFEKKTKVFERSLKRTSLRCRTGESFRCNRVSPKILP